MRVKAKGIVLVNSTPHIVTFKTRLIDRGNACVYVNGFVTQSFNDTVYRLINEAISSGLNYQIVDFAVDISIQRTDGSPPRERYPLAGSSYGLPLALALRAAYYHRSLPPGLIATGEVTNEGTVLPVGGINEKRIGASAAKFSRIYLPAGQVDTHCRYIDQVPVTSVSSAFERLCP